ncbi:hypothetical protein SAY87_009920 [Trapa incisa]|uniref:Senescence regulator n=2 Tax=Trapa TaxID=22665 RepID=A0AAN7LSD5_TRANT|nr:hypothetical protein SAY87_009920 [Trapa incisa]KAK4794578.1 hypothetical protein SAY86_012572 [Trapa natans]
MERPKLRDPACPPPIRYMGRLKPPDPGTDQLELQESDVFWSSDFSDPDPVSSPRTPTSPTILSGNPSVVHQRPAINPALSAVSGARAIPHPQQSLPARGGITGLNRMSAPVNVPVWPKWKDGSGRGFEYDEEEDWEPAQGKMVPPHEIVARSHATTALSVFEGAGHTLKGRDLMRVRNAVFRRTGFLD